MNKYIVKYRFMNDEGQSVWSIVNVEADNKMNACIKAKEKLTGDYVIFDVIRATI